MTKIWTVDCGTGGSAAVDLSPEREQEFANSAADDAIRSAAELARLKTTLNIRVDARVRTTDGAATELLRRTLAPLTGYVARFELIAVDAGNGAVKVVFATVAAKRLGAGALMVGTPTVLSNHADPAASAWAVAASASSNDFVITVTGAAGRTIDWLLYGSVTSFTPGAA